MLDAYAIAVAARVITALLCVAAIVMAFVGWWVDALWLAGGTGICVLLVVADDRLPRLFTLLFVAAMTANIAGYAFGLFHAPGPYDELVHGFTIFSLTAALGFLVFRRVFDAFSRHPLLCLLAIASFGIAVGVFWEFFEWAIGLIGPLPDTLSDLAMDTIGATCAGAFSAWAIRERYGREAARQ